MQLRKGVDLGKAFDQLKDALIESKKEIKSYEDINMGYAAGYGKLFANVHFFLFWNSDAPTMDSILQTEPNDIPADLFTQGVSEKEK